VELSVPITTAAAMDTLSAVRAEQVRRWRAGERPPAEGLLASHPELAADEEAALVLVYGEVLLREEIDGTPPDPAEYAARFPDYAGALNRQFELHGALDPLAGPDLSGFGVVRELGRGGAGVVYLAREVALDRLVAVKVLLSGEFASASARRRFHTEAEAAANLRHPNIVPLYAIGESAGRPYLVFEYVAGGSLDKHLAGTPLAPRAAAELLRPLADAVAHAHAAGVVHRDLKPANVLLAPPGSPKIADFGLAKRIDGDGPTATSQVLGTPSYMAPEQAVGAKDVGPAADIYALGAILYECLTGRPPFKAATALETLAHVTGREPAAPHSLNPVVPRDLETICLKCLAKEPAKRYSSAAHIGEDLGRFLDGKPVFARPVGLAGRTWRWAKRRPAVAAPAAALMILMPTALAATIALYLHADGQRLRAEERERDSLRWRKQSAIAMSNHALALTKAFSDQSAIDAHRACIDEFTRLIELDIDPGDCRERRAFHLDQLSVCLSRNWRADEALQASHKAVDAYEAMRLEQPASAGIRGQWLQARQNLGFALRTARRWADAAHVLDDVINDCRALGEPRTAAQRPLRLDLTGAHFDRGLCRYHLGCFAEAVEDYDEGLRRSDGRLWAELTLARANSLTRCGRAAEAVEACRGPLANPHLKDAWVFEAAIVYAAASVASEMPPANREEAATASVAVLRRLLAMNSRWKRQIATDPVFDPLRDRPDFSHLLSGK
jgi:tetratricopeptide (TPR) repeat protein